MNVSKLIRVLIEKIGKNQVGVTSLIVCYQAGSEAVALGREGIKTVAFATGLSTKTNRTSNVLSHYRKLERETFN